MVVQVVLIMQLAGIVFLEVVVIENIKISNRQPYIFGKLRSVTHKIFL